MAGLSWGLQGCTRGGVEVGGGGGGGLQARCSVPAPPACPPTWLPPIPSHPLPLVTQPSPTSPHSLAVPLAGVGRAGRAGPDSQSEAGEHLTHGSSWPGARLAAEAVRDATWAGLAPVPL